MGDRTCFVAMNAKNATETVSELEGMGHGVEIVGEYALGSIQGILENPATGTLAAGADPRRVAYAIGW